VIPITYLVIQHLPATAAFAKRIGPNWSGIAAYAGAAAAMVVGSLLKPILKPEGAKV
jgi:SSS family solute:Na+ symporter